MSYWRSRNLFIQTQLKIQSPLSAVKGHNISFHTIENTTFRRPLGNRREKSKRLTMENYPTHVDVWSAYAGGPNQKEVRAPASCQTVSLIGGSTVRRRKRIHHRQCSRGSCVLCAATSLRPS